MVLAMTRLIRDISEVGSDYRAFLEKGHRAAFSFWQYHPKACEDLMNEMEARDTENAQTTCQLLAYTEIFAEK
jgi:hypothetical protein